MAIQFEQIKANLKNKIQTQVETSCIVVTIQGPEMIQDEKSIFSTGEIERVQNLIVQGLQIQKY